MISLDLFRTTSEGTEWLGTFLDLNTARGRLVELACLAGQYSICDQATGEELFAEEYLAEQSADAAQRALNLCRDRE
jgi:hypothetical protein